ncbi:hypothetical protein [Nocardioides sp.]|uniref:hypothetical protein n=1 Tax=Nocardioides sp. TaxID=35761 RepID=UPI00273248AE|nr:hypothetical protein [Nocardioides sp.]MDP3891813.1 hypothetical protein [Nocardioides sp.]
MSEEPGEHLDEEPQEERGPEGSRDTGSPGPGGGPVDRPEGRADDEGADSDTGIDAQGPGEADAPDLQSGGG